MFREVFESLLSHVTIVRFGCAIKSTSDKITEILGLNKTMKQGDTSGEAFEDSLSSVALPKVTGEAESSDNDFSDLSNFTFLRQCRSKKRSLFEGHLLPFHPFS